MKETVTGQKRAYDIMANKAKVAETALSEAKKQAIADITLAKSQASSTLAAAIAAARRECKVSNKTLYKGIVDRIQEWIGDLRAGIGNLKTPSDLPGELDKIDTTFTDYDPTKDIGDQKNIQSIYEEIDLLRGYLSEINNKYQQWYKVFQKGGSTDDLVRPILAEQGAWETMNSARNAIEPEYRKLLPESDPAPVDSLVEPFNRYVAENADPEHLEEARNAVGMMSPEDIDIALQDDMDKNAPIDRLIPIYRKALPRLGKEWVPIMVRADILKTLLQATENH